MAIEAHLQQPFGKEVPLGLGQIIPVHDVGYIQRVAFVNGILLDELDESILGEMWISVHWKLCRHGLLVRRAECLSCCVVVKRKS